MRKLWLFFVFALVAVSSASVKCAFPCQTDYSSRGVVVSRSWAADSLKLKFTRWLSNHYEESGSLARVKFDSPNTQYTVSEGIGYGMLLMVYFSDNTTSYKAQFDKLWAYYQKFSNGNGLMHWKINGFSSVTEQNGATDAEMDVGVALIMAYYQFNDSKYLTAAKTLIASIKSKEVSGNNLLKPGDAWEDYRNPSYVAPAAFDKFGAATSDVSSWNAIKSANYTLLTSNQHATTGLFSDWSNASGTPDKSNSNYGTADVFYYDACRVPWRMAWGYFWNGDATAKTLSDKLGKYMMSKTSNNPTLLRSGYYRSTGAVIDNYASSAFLGSLVLASATTKSTANQAYVDSGFVRLMKMGPSYNLEKYFNATLQLLTGLMMSGFFPDLSLATPGHTPVYSSSLKASSSSVKASSAVIPSSNSVPTSSATVGSSSSIGGSDLAINGFSIWGTYVDDNGTSTVTPLPGVNPLQTDGATVWAKATMVKGPNESPYPFVGLMLQLDPEGNPVNMASAYSITLRYQASSDIRMALMQTNTTGGGAEFGITLTPSSSWTTVTIPITNLAQPDWAESASWTRALDMAHTTGVKWEVVQGSHANEQSVSGSIQISSITFNGWVSSIYSMPQVSRGLVLKAGNGVIRYSAEQSGLGRIEVRDLMGHVVATPVNGWIAAGTHEILAQVPARGVYIVRVVQAGVQQTVRMTVR